MRTFLQPFGVLIVLVAAVVVAGCSDSYGGRKEVFGTVKLVGEPVDDGMIHFIPLDKQASKQDAQIVKGEYKIPRKQGLQPGWYQVAISAPDAKISVNPVDETAGPGPSRNVMAVDRVPEEWNINSKEKREVKADAVNKFDFDIPNYNPMYLKKKGKK
jgi:hypothetical protein